MHLQLTSYPEMLILTAGQVLCYKENKTKMNLSYCSSLEAKCEYLIRKMYKVEK